MQSAAFLLFQLWMGSSPAAYAAMGGDKLAALKTLKLNAHLGQWDPGESYSLSDPDKPGVNSSELAQMWDFSRGSVRNDWWDRPNNDGQRRKFVEVVTLTA